jgi:hypothetical protein
MRTRKMDEELRLTKKKLEDVDCEFNTEVELYFADVDVSKLNIYTLAELIEQFQGDVLRNIEDMSPNNWDTFADALFDLCYQVRLKHVHLIRESNNEED